MLPPCGVPLSDHVFFPSSSTPALSHFLFGSFSGTTRPSDCSRSCINGLLPQDSRCGSRHHQTSVANREPSRFPCKMIPHMLGVSDRGGAESGSPVAPGTVLPSDHRSTSAPSASVFFRGSIPGLHVPLSTLRPQGGRPPVYPRGWRRMTRGRCGWLALHRKTLSFSSSCRSPGAHRARSILLHFRSRPEEHSADSSPWNTGGRKRAAAKWWRLRGLGIRRYPQVRHGRVYG